MLKAPHPSPLSAHRGFFGSNHFVLTNEWLEKRGEKPIDWMPVLPAESEGLNVPGQARHIKGLCLVLTPPFRQQHAGRNGYVQAFNVASAVDRDA